MTTPTRTGHRERIAFTLIELIVVISIIGILAALTFPTVANIKTRATRAKVKAELRMIETAIESYKARYGFYPPDNPGNSVTNQLFYELRGTINTNGTSFETLDHSETFAATALAAFGSGIAGFVNCTRAGGSDEVKSAKNFLPGLRLGQYGVFAGVRVLTSSVVWPTKLGDGPLGVPELNPVQYNSSSPAHNSGSFDLWVDIVVGGKTNRISNWSEQPQFN